MSDSRTTTIETDYLLDLLTLCRNAIGQDSDRESRIAAMERIDLLRTIIETKRTP